MAEDKPLGAPPETPKKIAQGRGPLSFPEPKSEGKAIANSRSVEDSAAAGSSASESWKDEQATEARSFGEQQR